MLMGEFVDYLMTKANNPAPSLLNAICKKKPDLEFLIEQLQEISDKGYLAQPQEKMRGDGAMWYTAPAECSDLGVLTVLATSLLSWVKQQVYQHYRSLEDPAKTTKLLHGLLVRMGVAPGFTVVFTTNYDPSVEEMCRLNHMKIVDGFRHDEDHRDYVWDRRVFETFSRTGNPTVALFKIHGSTDWLKHGDRIVKAPPSSDAPGAGYQRMMIYPAQSKVASEEPFFTGYDFLQRCLSRAEFCLTVGYSFRDYDTVMRFRVAARTNKKLRVAVLDPSAQKLCRELCGYGVRAEPILYLLGENPNAYYSVIQDMLKC